MSNKIYPIGIQNFEKIRQDGYFYVDKTALMYQMVKTGSYYFLSRPRRFWKESADLYPGSIFSREEGTICWTDGGEARKRLDRTSNFAS